MCTHVKTDLVCMLFNSFLPHIYLTCFSTFLLGGNSFSAEMKGQSPCH